MKKLIFLAYFFSIIIAGCDPISPFISPIVTGAVIWSDGKATKYYEASPKVAYIAVKRACKDLNYKIITDKPTKSGYYVVAGNNDRFKIWVTQAEPNISSVVIRVNFLGDKPYAELFYKKLDTEVEIIYFDDNGSPTRLD